MLKFVILFTFLFSVSDVNAQMLFDGSQNTNPPKASSVVMPKKEVKKQIAEEENGITLGDLTSKNSSSANDLAEILSKSVNESAQKTDLEENANKNVAEDEDIFIPEGELYRLNAPTFDGSSRGGQAFVEVDEKGRMKKADNIFLFYDEFKITNYMSNTATCDVRFNILSNLDRKVTQLDVKLVWPDITTTLSFSDINPNTRTYYNYSLIGNGCYGMDVAPNIIVNRCRVKGYSASECANKLIWLSK